MEVLDMKKVIALILCLSIAAPCFAWGGHHARPYHKHHRPAVVHQNIYHYKCNHRNNCCYRTSSTTKTLAAVAGITAVAAVVSAIID